MDLSKFPEANNYYFDDIEWTVTTRYTGTRPQTDEEKRDNLIYAMDNWIKGMMEACGGYVTAWDVVNEFTVKVNERGAEIQPTMYGIFIEDINFAAVCIQTNILSNKINKNCKQHGISSVFHGKNPHGFKYVKIMLHHRKSP